MSRLSYILRDASDDPSACDRANFAPVLRDALMDLGFYSMGVLEANRSKPLTREAGSSIDSAQLDTPFEVFCSRDVLMFGVIERTLTYPVLAFTTILENGVIVETTMRPAPAPERDRRLSAWIGRVIRGEAPLWRRSNRPSSGLYVELVDTREVRTLYDRHLARLNQARERYKVSIPHQDSLEVFRAIHVRFLEIRRQQWLWLQGVDLLIVMMMAIALMYVPRNASLMDILFMLYAIILGLLAIGLVNRFIIPEIGVHLVSLQRLRHQQEAEWGSLPISSTFLF